MSILSEIKQQKHSLDDLAKLPQSMIMQMAQRKEIMPEMVAPILSRKAEMMESVAKTKALQSAPQAMAQPTVMESLMAKNAQAQNPQPQQQAQPMAQPAQPPAEMAGLGQMQAPPQFAGGGIIAFKQGDYVEADDIDPEDEEFDRHQAYLNRIVSAYGDNEAPSIARQPARSPDVVVALASPTSRTYEAERSSVAEKRPEQSAPAVKEVTKERISTNAPAKATPKATNHPYAALVAQDAQKYGNDQATVLKILNNETGGLKNPEKAVSPAGAVGIAQFMPKTAEQYKIDPTDPRQASDAMNKHVKHLMKEYGDPQLVAIAYNWGEGNTNRWLKTGADPRKLPKETQNYLDKFMRTALAKGGEVQGYAEGGEINAESYAQKMKSAFGYEPFHGPTAKKYMSGGEVQHFDTGSTVRAKPQGSVIGQEISDFFGNLYDKAGRLIRYANPEQDGFSYSEAPIPQNQAVEKSTVLQETARTNPIKKPEPVVSTPMKPYNPSLRGPSLKDIEEKQAEDIKTQQANLPIEGVSEDMPASVGDYQLQPPKAVAAPEEKVPTEYDILMQKLNKRQDALDAQRKEDKAYAHIMSGLATMGGESPDAFTNIAKGQMAGLSMLQENRKQSAAEDARLLQMQGTVLRYKDANLLAKEAQKDRDDFRNRDLALREQMARDNKTAKDEKLIADKQVARDRAEAKLREGLRLHADSHMRKAKVLAEARYAAAKNAVLPEEQAKLMAEGDRILSEAEDALQSDPIYVKGMTELFSDTGVSFAPPKQPAAPAKAISFDQLPKKK